MTARGDGDSPSSAEDSTDENQQDNNKGGFMAVAKVILGNGSYVGLGFLANVFSANGLTPAQFGLVSIALATLSVLQEVCGNGLDLSMVRLAAPHVEKDPNKAATFYRAALQLKLLVNGAIALGLYLLAPWLAVALFNAPDLAPLLQWVSFGLMGACMFNYMLSRVQAEERFTLYMILRGSNNVGKLIVLCIIWWLAAFSPNTVMGAWMGAFFIGYGLALMLGATRNAVKPTGPLIQPAFWKEIFHFSKWVIASSFLFSMYSRVDMLILSRYVDSAAIGQYAAAWNITFIIDLMTYSIIIALLPQAVKIQRHQDFPEYLKKTFAICAVVAVMLTPSYFLAGWFFSVFFPAYTDSAALFEVLFLGAIITLLFHPLYLILYARNRVNRLTLINLLLLLFCTAMGLAVIPVYGAPGAAWVTVIGRVFASVLICYFVHRELKAIFADEQYR